MDSFRLGKWCCMTTCDEISTLVRTNDFFHPRTNDMHFLLVARNESLYAWIKCNKNCLVCMIDMRLTWCRLPWFIYAEGANLELVGFHNADTAIPFTGGQHCKNFHSPLIYRRGLWGFNPSHCIIVGKTASRLENQNS